MLASLALVDERIVAPNVSSLLINSLLSKPIINSTLMLIMDQFEW